MDAWTRAVTELGGDEHAALAAAAELEARYAEPHRRYHDTHHLRAVLRDTAALAEETPLSGTDRAVLALAAAAHDVVYQGRPGEDERASAAWARERLVRAGVAEEHVARVERLVLATITHTAPPHEPVGQLLLDADLAVLGADAAGYERYRAAVRAEYAHVGESDWRKGRAAVLTGLLAKDPLYRTGAARERWEAHARANLAAELRSLRSPE